MSKITKVVSCLTHCFFFTEDRWATFLNVLAPVLAVLSAVHESHSQRHDPELALPRVLSCEIEISDQSCHKFLWRLRVTITTGWASKPLKVELWTGDVRALWSGLTRRKLESHNNWEKGRQRVGNMFWVFSSTETWNRCPVFQFRKRLQVSAFPIQRICLLLFLLWCWPLDQKVGTNFFPTT